MSILRHSHRDFVTLETKIGVIRRSHREKRLSIFLIMNGKQRFFGSISTICYFAGAEAQRCLFLFFRTYLYRVAHSE